MSKNINVNPNFYKVGGREHTEGADKGDTHYEPKGDVSNTKKSALEEVVNNTVRTKSKKK
jgi:hypothetical protein